MGTNCCKDTKQVVGEWAISLSPKTPKSTLEQSAETTIPTFNRLVQSRIDEFSKRPLLLDNNPNSKLSSAKPDKSNSYLYSGSQLNQKPHGFGKVYFFNGEYFQGEFKDGLACGIGRYVENDGSYYEGEIEASMAQGEGKYVADGLVFEGEWSRSRPVRGRYKLGSGTVVDVEPGDKGRVMFGNGDEYVGGISEGFKPQGQGRMKFANGNVYDGGWENGRMCGKGKYEWVDGQSYEGQYKEGLKHGQGTFNYGNNRRYQGQWSQGKQHGLGKLSKNDQIVYEGQFSEGKPNLSKISSVSSSKRQSFIKSIPYEIPMDSQIIRKSKIHFQNLNFTNEPISEKSQFEEYSKVPSKNSKNQKSGYSNLHAPPEGMPELMESLQTKEMEVIKQEKKPSFVSHFSDFVEKKKVAVAQ